MGLAQNLKRILNDWVDKTLVALSSAYIKQLAKQTLKKSYIERSKGGIVKRKEEIPNFFTL